MTGAPSPIPPAALKWSDLAPVIEALEHRLAAIEARIETIEARTFPKRGRTILG